jgi:DNA-directed RNA polymerase subunit RPC12/RpoP
VDSIEEAKLRRCERCGGQVFVERDTATPVYVDDRRLRR